jgi:hypothetical protein
MLSAPRPARLSRQPTGWTCSSRSRPRPRRESGRAMSQTATNGHQWRSRGSATSYFSIIQMTKSGDYMPVQKRPSRIAMDHEERRALPFVHVVDRRAERLTKMALEREGSRREIERLFRVRHGTYLIKLGRPSPSLRTTRLPHTRTRAREFWIQCGRASRRVALAPHQIRTMSVSHRPRASCGG